MKFAVISNNSKDPEKLYLKKVRKEVEEAGGTVCFCETFGIGSNLSNAWDNQPDFILAMGGDGTFLNIAGRTMHLGIPILGINIGSMGFLSGVEVNETRYAIDSMIRGDYRISNRMTACAEVFSNGEKTVSIEALNDIVISRGMLSRIVNVATYIDGKYVDSFPGDGAIVSTPTGSTGYSLSAGGPVIDHGIELFVITPICPHIMHARPFVTGADSEIRMVVKEEGEYKCILTADGQKGLELKGGDEVVVKRGSNEIKLVKIGSDNLYETLREKIYYRKAGEA